MAETAQERKRYSPLVLTETESLSRDQWLEYRRLGIGGSDVAAIMGISLMAPTGRASRRMAESTGFLEACIRLIMEKKSHT